MRSVIWLFFWPTFISFVFAYVFYVLRDEAEELPRMVPSGRHFRVRQNQPEYAPGWFGSKWHWLLIFLMFLVILKFPGGDDKSNAGTPPGRQGCSSGSPGRKKIRPSPYKESMCGALTQSETSLMNLMSRVKNMKLTVATGDQCQCPNIEVPGDARNNVTILEVWDTGDPDEVDFHIKEEKE
uniref:Protein FAM209A n=2 Tax=Bos TaxID=9903 RepID=A0ABI0P4S6_BOVIN